MKRNILNYVVLFLVLSAFLSVLGACPVKNPTLMADPNPPFFQDITPPQGPWDVEQKHGKVYYAKFYTHRKLPVMIVATFGNIPGDPNVNMTDPKNQQALAEHALKGVCNGLEINCLVRSSDVAWIIGSPLKYVYVRFMAQKAGHPVMKGLLYSRYDAPIQTLYLLIAPSEVFDTYEGVFLDYIGSAKFNPELQ